MARPAVGVGDILCRLVTGEDAADAAAEARTAAGATAGGAVATVGVEGTLANAGGATRLVDPILLGTSPPSFDPGWDRRLAPMDRMPEAEDGGEMALVGVGGCAGAAAGCCSCCGGCGGGCGGCGGCTGCNGCRGC